MRSSLAAARRVWSARTQRPQAHSFQQRWLSRDEKVACRGDMCGASVRSIFRVDQTVWRLEPVPTVLAENYAPKAHTGSMPSLHQPAISAPVPRSLTPDPCSLTPVFCPTPHPPYPKTPLFSRRTRSGVEDKSHHMNYLQINPGGRPVALVVNIKPRKRPLFGPKTSLFGLKTLFFGQTQRDSRQLPGARAGWWAWPRLIPPLPAECLTDSCAHPPCRLST